MKTALRKLSITDAQEAFIALMDKHQIRGRSVSLGFTANGPITLHVEYQTGLEVPEALQEMQDAGCWDIQIKTATYQTPVGPYSTVHVMADYIND